MLASVAGVHNLRVLIFRGHLILVFRQRHRLFDKPRLTQTPLRHRNHVKQFLDCRPRHPLAQRLVRFLHHVIGKDSPAKQFHGLVPIALDRVAHTPHGNGWLIPHAFCRILPSAALHQVAAFGLRPLLFFLRGRFLRGRFLRGLLLGLRLLHFVDFVHGDAAFAERPLGPLRRRRLLQERVEHRARAIQSLPRPDGMERLRERTHPLGERVKDPPRPAHLRQIFLIGHERQLHPRTIGQSACGGKGLGNVLYCEHFTGSWWNWQTRRI